MRAAPVILALVACAPRMAPHHVQVEAPAGPTRRALLIGINRYRSPDLAQLRGSVNDVERMRGVLTSRFEVPPENLHVLTDEQATREAIISAIRRDLIDPTRPGDVVILHFSGHGSQSRTDSPDEPDGWDETIVPHDSRVGDVRDITDNELNALLSEAGAITPNVVVIFDSCHAGSAVRAAEAGTARQAPRDERPPAPNVGRARGVGVAPERALAKNSVFISGAAPNELSNEAPYGDRVQGALTWALARALELAPPRATWRDVMDGVQVDVAAHFSAQHPQLEGPGADSVLFGEARLAQRPFVLVEPTGGNGVSLTAGQIMGLVPGMLLRVFPPGTKDFAEPNRSARVKVTSVDAFSATGEVQPGGRVQAHSRAPLDAVGAAGFITGVVLEGGPPTLLEAVRRGLHEFDFVREVTTGADAHLRLRPEGTQAVLLNREGERLGASDATSAGAAAEITERIVHWAQWNAALALENPNPSMQVGLTLERFALDGRVEPAPNEVPVGTKLRVTVENTSTQPLYMVLLDLASDGSVQPLWPDPALPPTQVGAGRSITLEPDAVLPEGSERSFDVLKVVATTEPLRADAFLLSSAKSIAREGPLSTFLRANLHGRRGGQQPIAIADWVTVQRALRVVRRASARAQSFALHYAAGTQPRVTRAACAVGVGLECAMPLGVDPTVFEVRRAVAREAGAAESVGDVFEEAYRLQRASGARRVEPLFEVEVPAPSLPPGARGSLFDSGHDDPRADADPEWSLHHVRVGEAWRQLREAGRPDGAEATGVTIAHPDTGYRQHPEIWSANASLSPVWSKAGYDYVNDDHDATDDLNDDRLLDNPGHGTGSGSAIVSPAGCQVPNTTKCPTGVARGARLVPLRVHRSVVHFDTRQLSLAIAEASRGDRAHLGAATDLMSLSMGGLPSWTLWRAVTGAEQRGYLIIAAAGNYVRFVVWPARFHSTIAVAATNAGCRAWPYSSMGASVDVSAPGESVWRAAVQKVGNGAIYSTGMSSGTTYATATVAGVAALWLAKYKDTPAFKTLKARGAVTEAFRQALKETVWRPGTSSPPAGVPCDPGVSWNDRLMGPGIVDADALLRRPLSETLPRAAAPAQTFDDLPLFASLYSPEASRGEVSAGYQRLFRGGVSSETAALFEAELMHHVALNTDVAKAIDSMVSGDPSAATRATAALRRLDLSASLRGALAP